MCEHSLLPRGRLATPLHNVNYTLNCHVHTRRLFETQRVLTREPGIPRLLNRTGVYLKPALIRANTVCTYSDSANYNTLKYGFLKSVHDLMTLLILTLYTQTYTLVPESEIKLFLA